MKKNFTLFYSWQSDLSNNANRSFISNCIEKALKEIVKENKATIDLQINLDRDTKGISGSPLIADTILEKISTCDIFIGDVTIITPKISRLFGVRRTPNPNVLIELGYAIKLLGWERIICVNNLKHSTIESLPFDIRGHRITSYDSNNKDLKSLSSTLKSAISSIINDYEEIVKRHNKHGFKSHDLEIYYTFLDICTQEILFESISTAVDSLFTTKYYYKIWRKLSDFYKQAINAFIDLEIDTVMKSFLLNLEKFDTLCATKFFDDRKYYGPTPYDIEQEGKEVTEEFRFEYEQSKVYSIIKEPFSTETWGDADARVLKIQDELFESGEKVKTSYRELIMTIKKKLLV